MTSCRTLLLLINYGCRNFIKTTSRGNFLTPNFAHTKELHLYVGNSCGMVARLLEVGDPRTLPRETAGLCKGIGTYIKA